MNGFFKWLARILLSRYSKPLINIALETAIDICQKLRDSNLSNEDRRKQAFDEIKHKFKQLPDSVVNLLIELAYQFVRTL